MVMPNTTIGVYSLGENLQPTRLTFIDSDVPVHSVCMHIDIVYTYIFYQEIQVSIYQRLIKIRRDKLTSAFSM